MVDTPFSGDRWDQPSEIDPLIDEAWRREQFNASPFGWVDSKLKGASDWIKGRSQKRLQGASPELQPNLKNPMSWGNVSPIELGGMMLTEGARTANRWLYGTKDPTQLRAEDQLGPLGMGAMGAPFAAAKHGVSLGSAGGKLAQAAQPFQRQVDDLGYYSKLDEVLGQLRPTDTVTMDTLAKRGVKAAEIEARGLSPFIADGKGAKVSDLQKDAQPVRLRESRYGVQPPAIAREKEAREMFEKPYDELTAAEKRQVDRSLDNMPFDTAKWRDYATDGDNPTYHEGVLHLPTELNKYDDYQAALRKKYGSESGGGWQHLPMTAEERAKLEALQETAYKEADGGGPAFQSGHWGEPNAIAHYRASMQPMEGGGNAYLIDEFQSDWGQKLRDGGVRDEAKIADLRGRIGEIDANSVSLLPQAREILTRAGVERDPSEWASMPPDRAMDLLGYIRHRVPEAEPLYNQMLEGFEKRKLLDAELRTAAAATPGNPFVNTSEQWMTTALRRMMRNAADQDAQGMAITPGAMHNERFGLEKHFRKVEYNPSTNELLAHRADVSGERPVVTKVPPEKLAEHVGAETAEKLLATAPDGEGYHALSGLDLRMGGEGMKYAYDKMLPKLLQKELQKLDPSIKYGQQNLLPYDQGAHLPISESPFHYFPLTDMARQKIKEGLPMFNNQGAAAAPFEVARAARELQSGQQPLDMSHEARMDRAKGMGFDTDQTWYHGTTHAFDEFDPSKGNPEGFMIRSPFAAFDPAKRDSANLLASNPGTEQILQALAAQDKLQQQ